MKKIPTLFVRRFEGRKIIDITNEINSGCEEAFKNGIATIKHDGMCCAIINGEFYKRYDAKKGKTPPEGAIPCCNPDPVTGHWPHWIKVNRDDPDNKYLMRAYYKTLGDNNGPLEDGTYEAIGPRIQGNPYNIEHNALIPHGKAVLNVERTFEGVMEYLRHAPDEGIVFWLNNEPVCKIKRTDFGYKWPIAK